jgi:hypothetical protein
VIVTFLGTAAATALTFTVWRSSGKAYSDTAELVEEGKYK